VRNYVNSDKVTLQTYDEILFENGKSAICQADISDEKQCIHLIMTAIDTFGKLDIVINNAGTTEFVEHKNFDTLTDDIWQKTLTTHGSSIAYCASKAALIDGEWAQKGWQDNWQAVKDYTLSHSVTKPKTLLNNGNIENECSNQLLKMLVPFMMIMWSLMNLMLWF
jgi:hypothetical protein